MCGFVPDLNKYFKAKKSVSMVLKTKFMCVFCLQKDRNTNSQKCMYACACVCMHARVRVCAYV